jgi:hypothetical protein
MLILEVKFLPESTAEIVSLNNLEDAAKKAVELSK